MVSWFVHIFTTTLTVMFYHLFICIFFNYRQIWTIYLCLYLMPYLRNSVQVQYELHCVHLVQWKDMKDIHIPRCGYRNSLQKITWIHTHQLQQQILLFGFIFFYLNPCYRVYHINLNHVLRACANTFVMCPFTFFPLNTFVCKRENSFKILETALTRPQGKIWLPRRRCVFFPSDRGSGRQSSYGSADAA